MFVLVAALACRSAEVTIDPGAASSVPAPDGPSTGFATGPWEDPTTPPAPVDEERYEGAYARIDSPRAAEVLPLGEPSWFEVTAHASDGSALPIAAVEWFASEDPDWSSAAPAFESATLGIGTHEITAVVELEDGSRVAHAVGGVAVQSAVAGTYAGLFSVDGSVTAIPISCTGSAVIVLDQAGQTGEGDGDCVVSLLGLDVPMTWDFVLDSTGAELTGEASVDLVGFFSYDVPMTAGSVDPAGAGLALEFFASVPLVGDVSATVDAPRVSLDTEP